MARNLEHLETDILILGAGGAGLVAALHAQRANPDLKVAIAVKGLLGKCGCTRMVQGGYNAAVVPGDSVERHFMDTINGGTLAAQPGDGLEALQDGAGTGARAGERDRLLLRPQPDGTCIGKAFAGQTFDRTVHKGDLTGIEIINRLMEQVMSRRNDRLEEHRAIGLIPMRDGEAYGRRAVHRHSQRRVPLRPAKAVLLATGGGPTMYRYHTPSGDKSMDGLAMALRARPAAARHGDGAVPSHRPAGRRRIRG